MKRFIAQPSKVHEFLGYFEAIRRQFEKLNKTRNIQLQRKSYLPTIVVPGKYTSRDGVTFAMYLATFHDAGLETVYTRRLMYLFDQEANLAKRHQFTCSGGDSNLGISSGKAHICHRTFYLDNDNYIKAVLDAESSIGETENWDVSLFRKGTIKFIRDSFIVPSADLIRFRYILRGYHDFWRLQLGHVRAMLIELALANQVDRVFLKSEDLSILFALFISSALSCPMENLLNTGSIHLQTVSLLRMFGNGAFQELIKEVSK